MGARGNKEITIERIQMAKETMGTIPVVPKGFKNIGNTCYMNASLQCLLQTPGLANMLLDSVDCTGSHAQCSLLQTYRALLLKQPHTESKSTSELRRMKKAIKQQYRAYGGYRQMDPTEFFLHLIGCFEDLSAGLKLKLKELFGVETVTKQTCEKCGNEVIIPSGMLSLSLPLQPAKVEFQVINGEGQNPVYLVRGNEEWTVADIVHSLNEIQSCRNFQLVLQSDSSIERIPDPSESLRELALRRNQLCYYDITEDFFLLELKIYHKKLLGREFLRLIVKKIPRNTTPEKLCELLKTECVSLFSTNKAKFKVFHSGKRVAKFTFQESNIDFGAIQVAIDGMKDKLLRVRINLRMHINEVIAPIPHLSPYLNRIVKAISLEDCLEYFREVEHLSEEHLVDCATCAIRTKCSRQSLLQLTSRNLVICLQRYSAFEGAKDGRTVQFNETIDLQQYFTEPRECKYELYAVIKHRGTASRGHYTSCVKGAGHWYHCNDSSVRVIETADLQSTLEEGAYVLFYSKCSA